MKLNVPEALALLDRDPTALAEVIQKMDPRDVDDLQAQIRMRLAHGYVKLDASVVRAKRAIQAMLEEPEVVIVTQPWGRA